MPITLRLNGRFNAVLAIVRHSYLTNKDNRMIDLRLGDCLKVMKTIKDNSIDAIITDPPYGTTACKWDSVIDFDLMWEQLNRIIKPNGAIVLFGSEPFSSALRMSNIKNFKYDWIWEKNQAGNISASKSQPMKYHEVINVFYSKKTTFNKQMIERSEGGKNRVKQAIDNNIEWKPTFKELNGVERLDKKYKSDKYSIELKNPSSIIYHKKDSYGKNHYHPTQKPISLMEYLIKTYTNDLDFVLDFTMGSGSTMVACKNLNRHGIGIEKEEKYFKIAQERINSTLF